MLRLYSLRHSLSLSRFSIVRLFPSPPTSFLCINSFPTTIQKNLYCSNNDQNDTWVKNPDELKKLFDGQLDYQVLSSKISIIPGQQKKITLLDEKKVSWLKNRYKYLVMTPEDNTSQGILVHVTDQKEHEKKLQLTITAIQRVKVIGEKITPLPEKNQNDLGTFYRHSGLLSFDFKSKAKPFLPSTTNRFFTLSDMTDPDKLPDILAQVLMSPQYQQAYTKFLDSINRQLFIMRTLSEDEKRENPGSTHTQNLVDRFKERFRNLKCPDEVRKVIKKELVKFSQMDPSNPDYAHSRAYLETLISLPWEQYSKDNLELDNVLKVLDEDHYGLDDVKERILEFIAVASRKKDMKGKIICLVGPPGVGKTSIGKSVARALGREFIRFSVGGLSDASEIKGHRRTYVGSMPGKLLQSVKRSKTSNPVIMIDEIDKMSNSYLGDPSAALLEVLDTDQNATFMDHYLDIPYDLSKVLFLATANSTDTIQPVLLDRMEIVRLSGYITDEKVMIAKKYLIPELAKETGLTQKNLTIEDDALRALIKDYSRENGVRLLNQKLDKIHRKVALHVVKDGNESKHVTITKENLASYLGQKEIVDQNSFTSTPVGVAMGLAWTADGGSTLFFETVLSPSQRTLFNCTGHLGSQMKESCSVAHSFAHSFLSKIQPTNRFFESSAIHLHVPEGAVPKDGPSAGCTIVTSLLSLALRKPVRPNLGMTGELSLHGKILPIGGVREKLIAGREMGATCLIFPKANLPDYDILPSYLKEGIDVRFVTDYHQIYEIAFLYDENVQANALAQV